MSSKFWEYFIVFFILKSYSPPGPPPDLSFYTQQLAEQLGGSDKGPSGPSFLPENFQYMQAAVGPIGMLIVVISNVLTFS